MTSPIDTSLHLHIATADDVLRKHYTSLFHDILTVFAEQIPRSPALCVLDSPDPEGSLDAAVRGFHLAVREHGTNAIPFRELETLVCDPFEGVLTYDNLIYVHRRAMTSDISFVITLSHELQHFVQSGTSGNLLSVEVLLRALSDAKGTNGFIKASTDLPSEVDAILRSKKVTIGRFGEKALTHYFNSQIAKFRDTVEGERWNFIRNLPLDLEFNFPSEINRLILRHKTDLEAHIRQNLHEDHTAFRWNFADPDWWMGNA